MKVSIQFLKKILTQSKQCISHIIERKDDEIKTLTKEELKQNRKIKTLLKLQTINSNKITELYFQKREEKKMKKLNQALFEIGRQKYRKVEIQSLQNTPSSGIRINSAIINFVRNKNKLSYESQNQSGYREEIDRSYFEANRARAGNSLNITSLRDYCNYIEPDSFDREKIISLRTGLPRQPYITIDKYTDQNQKNNDNDEKYQLRTQNFNPKEIVDRAEIKWNLIKQDRLKEKAKELYQEQQYPDEQLKYQNIKKVQKLSPQMQIFKQKQQKLIRKPTKQGQLSVFNITTKNENQKSLKLDQISKYFRLQGKVIENEFNLINKCEAFLLMKKEKNNQFMNLIQTAQRDRPKTQQLRLRSYTAKESHRQRLSQLRKTAEQERRIQAYRNTDWKDWLLSLIQLLKTNRKEKESTLVCEYIFNILRNILLDEIKIEKGHIVQILECIQNDELLELNEISMKLIKALCTRFEITNTDLMKFSKFRTFFEENDFDKIDFDLKCVPREDLTSS